MGIILQYTNPSTNEEMEWEFNPVFIKMAEAVDGEVRVARVWEAWEWVASGEFSFSPEVEEAWADGEEVELPEAEMVAAWVAWREG